MNSADSGGFIFDWSYPAAFLWGFVVLMSLMGWGLVVGFGLVGSKEEKDWGWGLAAVWGMAVFLILSGPMIMFSVYSRTFVLFFLLIGLALFLGYSIAKRGNGRNWSAPPTRGLKVRYLILFGAIGLSYAGAVAEHLFNPYDDFAAYFALTKMLLDTGTLYDPFSFRLLGALGGQTALDTITASVLPWKYMHFVDMGIGGLILLFLVNEMVKGRDSATWKARLLLLVLAVTFSMPRANTASQITGAIFFMAAFRTMELIATRQTVGWKAALLLSGVVAGATTLRAHNIFFMGLLVLGFLSWRWRNEKQGRLAIIREALLVALALTVLTASWWAVEFRSSGSILYPLFRGDQNPAYETYSSHFPLLGTLCFIGTFYITFYFLPLFFPACLLKAGPDRQLLWTWGGSLLAISTLFVAQLTFAVPLDIYRYLAPVALAYALYVSGILARQYINPSGKDEGLFRACRTKLLVFMAVTALLCQGIEFILHSFVNVTHICWAIDARHNLGTNALGPISMEEEEKEYAQAFTHVPLGSKVFISLDYPFLLNYREHAIFSLDMAGASSPAPGLPYFQGAEPVKAYLLSQGIRYIAQAPFDQARFLHSRKIEILNKIGTVPAYRYFSTFELDMGDNLEQLAKSNQLLYDSPTIRIIDLQKE